MANAKHASGISPAKLALIIVLSVILLVMIVVQFGGRWAENNAQQHDRDADPLVAELTGAIAAEPTATTEPAAAESAWPEFPISQVLVHNPFALPKALRPPEDPAEQAREDKTPTASTLDPLQLEMRRRRAEFMASLQEQGVDMILMTPKGRVARVGDLTLRVGDVVEGLLVREITTGGVVLVERPDTPQP